MVFVKIGSVGEKFARNHSEIDFELALQKNLPMRYLFLLFFSFIFLLSYSQIEDSIESVNIITLHVPLSAEESGRSLSVITAEQLADLPVSTVEEALRTLPGVNINSRGGFGVQSDIGMRGSTFSQTLVLIDGIRFTEPLTGHLNNAIPIPLSEIAKIEVIRGPASSVYGADAVGGVIHIQTKTFLETNNSAIATTGWANYGQHNLFDTDLSVRSSLGKLNVSAGYKKTSSDGETYANPNFTDDEVFNNNFFINENYSTNFNIENFTVATQYQPDNEWNLNARFAQDKRNYNAKYFYTRSSVDESIEENEFYLTQFSATKTTENTRTNFATGFREGGDNFAFNPAFPANDHTTKRWSGIISHQWESKSKNQFVIGTQAEKTTIESTDRGNHEQNQLEFFSTGLFHFSDDFTTVLSVRGGHHSDVDFTFSPQASFSYRLNNAVLRSTIGTALRGADFTEKYVSFNLPQVAAERNIGNPFLETEEALSIDLGTDLLLTNQIQLSGTAFFRKTNNLIDYTIVNESEISYLNNLVAGENYFQAQNVGEAKTVGIEFQGEYEHQLSFQSSVAANLNYTYLHTGLSEDVVSKYLASHPKHQLQFNLSATVSGVEFSLTNQYIHRNGEAVDDFFKVNDNYLLSNARLGVQVTEQLQATGRINNIFNTDYQEVLGAQMPGRWAMGGLQWDIQ